jgi:hypothetical protein
LGTLPCGRRSPIREFRLAAIRKGGPALTSSGAAVAGRRPDGRRGARVQGWLRHAAMARPAAPQRIAAVWPARTRHGQSSGWLRYLAHRRRCACAPWPGPSPLPRTLSAATSPRSCDRLSCRATSAPSLHSCLHRRAQMQGNQVPAARPSLRSAFRTSLSMSTPLSIQNLKYSSLRPLNIATGTTRPRPPPHTHTPAAPQRVVKGNRVSFPLPSRRLQRRSRRR